MECRGGGGEVFDRFPFFVFGKASPPEQLLFSLGTPLYSHPKTFWLYGTKHTTLSHTTRLASFVVSVTEDAETVTSELAMSLGVDLQPQFAPPNFDSAALIHLAPVSAPQVPEACQGTDYSAVACLPCSAKQDARRGARSESRASRTMSLLLGGGRSSTRSPAFRIFTLTLDPVHPLHRTTKAACQDAS